MGGSLFSNTGARATPVARAHQATSTIPPHLPRAWTRGCRQPIEGKPCSSGITSDMVTPSHKLPPSDGRPPNHPATAGTSHYRGRFPLRPGKTAHNPETPDWPTHPTTPQAHTLHREGTHYERCNRRSPALRDGHSKQTAAPKASASRWSGQTGNPGRQDHKAADRARSRRSSLSHRPSPPDRPGRRRSLGKTACTVLRRLPARQSNRTSLRGSHPRRRASRPASNKALRPSQVMDRRGRRSSDPRTFARRDRSEHTCGRPGSLAAKRHMTPPSPLQSRLRRQHPAARLATLPSWQSAEEVAPPLGNPREPRASRTQAPSRVLSVWSTVYST